MMQILDCTLRDGGYYTDWDFDESAVGAYVRSLNHLPVDYIEVGYRQNPADEYIGCFGYCPVSVLRRIREQTTKKLAVMLNEKNTSVGDLPRLVSPLLGIIDMVRIATAPSRIAAAMTLARWLKQSGFEVALNLMYMSSWDDTLWDDLSQADGIIDVINMVDSYGSVMPSDIAPAIQRMRGATTCKIGFHGHNNLQLAFANTIAAIDSGADIIDSTLLGMGRGAGNLHTELLLAYLNKKHSLPVDFNQLSNAVTAFTPLYEKYRWGTCLPYILSGINSFPQKEVMEWVSNRIYSFNSIVRALENKKDQRADNAKYPVGEASANHSSVLVVGGGRSVERHAAILREYINTSPSTAVVFTTARYANLFEEFYDRSYFVLIGNECLRFSQNVRPELFSGRCVLPPYPRVMGTDVPDFVRDKTFELSEISFVDRYKDSVTAVALQLALNLTRGEILVAGYDGYKGEILLDKEATLMAENEFIFQAFMAVGNRHSIFSVTPTMYKSLPVRSIYQILT